MLRAHPSFQDQRPEGGRSRDDQQFEPPGSLPGSRIHRVYPGHAHKGVDLHQSVVIIEFLTAGGVKDAAAFKVPYPPQWVHAIEANLLGPRDG